MQLEQLERLNHANSEMEDHIEALEESLEEVARQRDGCEQMVIQTKRQSEHIIQSLQQRIYQLNEEEEFKDLSIQQQDTATFVDAKDEEGKVSYPPVLQTEQSDETGFLRGTPSFIQEENTKFEFPDQQPAKKNLRLDLAEVIKSN